MKPDHADTENRNEGVYPSRAWRRVLLWVILGALFGVVCSFVFFAYEQPGLLLKQMNLRYCG